MKKYCQQNPDYVCFHEKVNDLTNYLEYVLVKSDVTILELILPIRTRHL